ncbi:VanZ family protein [Protaetiibacter mangrovi]|uniref:VanZ family protein n=1 Tax=Protaetiibacter mangrovi TaxID=2970926 RepID=A0ABT1ZG81_9MICO|nr:VanZ family protein [Protaetiibacter mangrovi]MCS0499685.1 VanZ family protein [Protaetiibacter mangrovi]TPX03208.1 VanZ family protein [Schumannella luteola]
MLPTAVHRPAPPGIRRRALLVTLFVVYLALLTWLVMWKLHDPFIGRADMRSIKLVPFLPGDGFGASDPLEILGNVAVFVPFGVYLRLLRPDWRVARIALLAGALSLAFEVAQYVTAVGSSDVTDVIANTAGAILGFVVLAGMRRHGRGGAMLTASLAAATVIALVAAVAVVAGRPSLPAPGDGGAGHIVD